MARKKVGLVLSGGGALGFAHIGVLQVLIENNIPIDMIAGTSMGGLVAVCYALGKSTEEMEKLATRFSSSSFWDFNKEKGGLFSGSRLMKTLNKFLPDVTMQSLNIPVSVVACDIVREEEVVLSKGSIRDCVRATISIPALLSPKKINGKALIDGGVKNNLPIDVIKSMGADIVIAVDVIDLYKLKSAPKSPIETLIYTLNLLTKEQKYYKDNSCDAMIKPNLSSCNQISFNKTNAEKIIALGKKTAKSQIESIINLVR